MKRVVFRHKHEGKIGAIKCVRSLTGLGLKEAKELVEGSNPFIDLYEPSDQTLNELESYCAQFSVYEIPDETMGAGKAGFRERLTDIAVDAVRQRNFDLAKKLVEILETL